jgi:phage tail-like protein
MSLAQDPFQVFNFEVTFASLDLDKDLEGAKERELCSAAFSEVTGLEATMEPKVIKEGGRNFGPVQRVGQVTFATVILKRGLTSETDLWTWFNLVADGQYHKRMNAYIRVHDPAGTRPVRVWKLHRALPIKFKSPDLNASGTNIGIEELHIAHEALELVLAAPPASEVQAGGPEPGQNQTGVA